MADLRSFSCILLYHRKILSLGFGNKNRNYTLLWFGKYLFFRIAHFKNVIWRRSHQLSVNRRSIGDLSLSRYSRIYCRVTFSKRPEYKWKSDCFCFKKALYFSSFSCFTFFVFLRFFPLSESIYFVLKILGETLAPIALFAVGFQMELGSKPKKSENFIQPLSIGLIYKLLISPIMIFLIYIFLNINPNHLKVAILEAGMAPMITASIISIQMGFRPSLSAAFPGIGILCSIPTLFLFYFILENFF